MNAELFESAESGPRPIELRGYQSAAIDALRAGIAAGNRCQVLYAPTGAGKTLLAASMLRSAHDRFNRALFIVERVVLADQTSLVLERYGVPHGVMQAQHEKTAPQERIQIGTAQTLSRRGIPDARLIFVDEAHIQYRTISEWLRATDATVIALTATPFSNGMAELYSNVVNAATTNALVESGDLKPVRVFAARTIDMAGAHTTGGEWRSREIAERGVTLVGDIVSEWAKRTREHFGGPVKTLAYVPTVDYGALLCERFRVAGFRFDQISYRDNNVVRRRRLLDELADPASDLCGLVSCEALARGLDVPIVQCGIGARPYRKSLSGYVQQLGRIMRPFPGQDYGLWLDFSGNTDRFADDVGELFEHGVTDLRSGPKDKPHREPSEREKREMRCACGQILMPWDKTCPSCGSAVRPRKALISNVPGRMSEVSLLERRNRTTDWHEKRRWMAAFRSYGAAHHFKDGWAAHTYKRRFGVWPNDPRVGKTGYGPVFAEAASYIRSTFIRASYRAQ